MVDFVIGSLHDLQTAAAYIGSGEQEMSPHERMQIIETVERSQMRQASYVENHVLDLFSIDESDAVYQSFRSKTTMGLEVASLVAGGYGAVKGAMAFNRLSQIPMQAAKLAKQVEKPSLLKTKQIIEKLEIFLGKDSRLFKNNHGDLLIESKNGLRQFRIDLNHPQGNCKKNHLTPSTLSKYS